MRSLSKSLLEAGNEVEMTKGKGKEVDLGWDDEHVRAGLDKWEIAVLGRFRRRSSGSGSIAPVFSSSCRQMRAVLKHKPALEGCNGLIMPHEHSISFRTYSPLSQLVLSPVYVEHNRTYHLVQTHASSTKHPYSRASKMSLSALLPPLPKLPKIPKVSLGKHIPFVDQARVLKQQYDRGAESVMVWATSGQDQ